MAAIGAPMEKALEQSETVAMMTNRLSRITMDDAVMREIAVAIFAFDKNQRGLSSCRNRGYRRASSALAC